MEEQNDSHLIPIINGCRKGRRADQKKLYQFFYGYAMSICIRYSRDRDDAVEIMNDGFMKVFQYIDRFDRNKPFKPWLRRIMINAAIDYLRKYARFYDTKDFKEVSTLSTEEQVLSGISYEEILAMLRQLSPAYRTVFTLHAIEGFKHEEVAGMLGISVGTSKSNYAKAKSKLQDILNRFFETKNV